MARSLANPNITRSRLVLEVASEMVGGKALQTNPRYLQAKAVLRRATPGRDVVLTGTSTAEGIWAVARREVDLSIINPACVLSVAARGGGIFKKPMPVRAVTVIPSFDQFVIAVRRDSGLTSFEDIAARKPKLRVSMRGMKDHTLHDMFDDLAAAAGFSRADLATWGGGIRQEGALPHPGTAKFKALLAGEIDAIFDEGAHGWVNEVLDAGIDILPIGEATMRKLEAMGYRRGLLPKADFPKLPGDLLTLDFSGWTVFVHVETDDEVVTDICAALEARKDRIPWDGEGPLPLDKMCRETPVTPQTVPLHPAAERFWRACGYL
jgi:hypothetical protein